MIAFEDFLPAIDSDKTKVKFNMNAGNPDIRAWDLLMEDDPGWIEINAWKQKKGTKGGNNNLTGKDYLMSFAQYYPYGPEFFIFGGMYKIEMITPEVYDQVGYKLTLMDEYSEYIRRLIVKLEKPIGRNAYNKLYNSVQRDLNPEIYEITPEIKLGTFPGYSSVLLSHKQLQQVINEPKWKQALSNVKGVYCITDKLNGALYIGSASGDTGGIWQRWSEYADVTNLTGGNKTFEEIKDSGAKHIIDNFSYSILEIFDMRTKREDIIKREEYWKKVFQTVKYGMNN